ncbi:uncharacterized protein JCM15063_000545 [Sporobolomyces koalae]|uniref:uncharacterized protein n=1 Tax=Sporobolomyces koalae TaxID=500713 RepID=UPI00317A1880
MELYKTSGGGERGKFWGNGTAGVEDESILTNLTSCRSIPCDRWGQSAALLSPGATPHLLVTSGKTYVSGQTVLSTPSTSSLVSLDLSQPILDLANPPWKVLATTDKNAPISSYGNLVPLNQHEALYFGGDATGDPTVPVQTRNDSSWTLSLSTTSENVATWTSKTAEWTSQPERRELGFACSASNGSLTRAWIYGGLRADGSGIGFGDLWEMQAPLLSNGSLEADQVEWARSGSGPTGGPVAGLYDGTAVLVPSASDPTIYFVGGVDTAQNALAPLTTIYSFTPSTAIGTGTWASLTVQNGPASRRGHSAVYIGNNQIWISGGRDLAENTVFSDAWILDIAHKTWTQVKAAQETAWGSSSILLGETILTSFGYGINSPVSTALKVYAYGNDTWLDAYYPSYQTSVPANPKASSSGSSSSSSSAPDSSNPNDVPSNPKAHQPNSGSDSSSSSSSSSSSDTDASGSASSSSSSSSNPDQGSNWTSPGSPMDPHSTSPTDGASEKSSDKQVGPSKSLVTGAVVGSLLGALAIAAIGVYSMRKRKRNQYGSGPYGGTFFDGGKRFTGDGDNDDEERYGMIEKHASDDHKKRSGFVGMFTPRMGSVPVAGAAIGAGMYKKRRTDMLMDEADEHEKMWDQPAANQSRRGWTQFDDDDAEDASHANARAASESSTRIGVGIWGGMARSESVRSGTSYLGTNLGGFLGGASSSEGGHEYGGLARTEEGGDASLTPIAEWEEDEDEDEDADGTIECGPFYSAGARSTETHQTRTTSSNGHSHEGASIQTATRIARPFSPASSTSLYGSRFATPAAYSGPGASNEGIARSGSNSSSVFLSPIRRDNSSSWWSRIKHHQHSDVPTATAFEAIRDPAPAPNLDDARIETLDPFSDPMPMRATSLKRTDSIGEHGLMTSRATRGVHDRSISSNVSEVTATSSILEERMRGMDVVQRIRTGEGSEGSGGSNQVTPILSQDPFSDPLPPGSVIFAGSQAAFSPRATETPPPLPSSAQFPILPVILPPVPTRSQETSYAPSTPGSPRKVRLIGPRPQPSSALPSISRSGSVKDLVAQIERRSSFPSLATTASSPITPPSKATRSRTTRTIAGGSGGAPKVEHGLVKKPKLYIANP